jgi:hypothetical protein
MTDALSALDRISKDVARLAATVGSVRTKSVQPSVAQPIARAIARTYFELVRPELSVVQTRSGLVDEIDFVLQSLLRLASAQREKEAYLGQITEVRPYLLEATVDVMKARGSPRLILSQTERGILDTLTKMVPVTGASYEQALLDIAQGKRVSWRGSATELREVLREAIDHLARTIKFWDRPAFSSKKDERSLLKDRRFDSFSGHERAIALRSLLPRGL